MLPVQEEYMHPSMRGETRGPRPLKFSRLRYMELENAVMDSVQIADFIQKHRRTLIEFNFEDVKLRQGNWNDALEPLTHIAGNDNWKRCQEEVMDVPIILSPMDMEPRVMGPLLEDPAEPEEEIKTKSGLTISRWLSKGKSPQVKKSAKEGFLGSEHMKRFLRGSIFPSWK